MGGDTTGSMSGAGTGGYTTNLRMVDVTGRKAWLVWEHEGEAQACPTEQAELADVHGT